MFKDETYVSIYLKSDNYIPGEWALAGGNTLRTAIELCDYRLTEEDINRYVDQYRAEGEVKITNPDYYDPQKVKNPEAKFWIMSKEASIAMDP